LDLIDRIYSLDRILRHARYPVSHATLQERLECSRATVTRIIAEMRDFFGAPIEYDRSARGYRYAKTEDCPYELPGLWFSAAELHSLLAAHQLLTNAQPGLLEADLAPLRVRIESILKARGVDGGEAVRRVRILRMAARQLNPEPFRTVAGAVLGRRRLQMTYHGRASNERTERQVSPQRLTHYRDNWYLDAWDHGPRALRSPTRSGIPIRRDISMMGTISSRFHLPIPVNWSVTSSSTART
jgi:predicted DNA-binding transcriptional regulator YafY